MELLSLSKAFKNPSNFFIIIVLISYQLILQVFIVQDMDPNMVLYIELTLDFLREEIKKVEGKKDDLNLIYFSGLQ